MIGSDVIQVMVICADRPTQSKLAELIYEHLPKEGWLRGSLTVDSSVTHSTHDRDSLQTSMRVSKVMRTDAWPKGYFENLPDYDDEPRVTVAIQDPNSEQLCEGWEYLLKQWIKDGISVLIIILKVWDEDNQRWKVPPYTEFTRGVRYTPDSIEGWKEEDLQELAELIFADILSPRIWCNNDYDEVKQGYGPRFDG